MLGGDVGKLKNRFEQISKQEKPEKIKPKGGTPFKPKVVIHNDHKPKKEIQNDPKPKKEIQKDLKPKKETEVKNETYTKLVDNLGKKKFNIDDILKLSIPKVNDPADMIEEHHIKKLSGHVDSILSLAIVPSDAPQTVQDSELLPSGNYPKLISGSQDETIIVWGGELMEAKEMKGHKDQIWSLCVIPPEFKKLISGSFDGEICIWDLETYRLLKNMKIHRAVIKNILPLIDGKFVTLSLDQKMKCFDSNTYECINILSAPNMETTECMVVFSEKRLASGDSEGRIVLWDPIQTGDPLLVLEGHKRKITALAASGKIILSGSFDQTIRCWDGSTGKCLHVYKGHNSHISTITIFDDGMRFASGGSTKDCSVRVWALPMCNIQPDRPSTPATPVMGGSGIDHDPLLLLIFDFHQHQVSRILYLPPDRLVSASHDLSIRIYNLETGTCEKKLIGHEDSIDHLVSVTDKKLASAGFENHILLWDI